MGFLSEQSIKNLGFASVGSNALISEKASIYFPARISIGDNVRIDDYTILSAGNGGINIGNYVHIAAMCTLIGQETITLSDFSGLSSRVSIYSSTDDYSGATMTNPTVPAALTGVIHQAVHIGKHSIIGCGSVILPGAFLEDGVAIGALSLVVKRCNAFGIYMGSPVRKIGERKQDLLALEMQLLADTNRATN